jgi:TonB family protein
MTILLLTLRTSVVLAAALTACLACRKRSAALRHAVLAAGVAAALMVAPLSTVLPSWQVLPQPAATWSNPASDGAQPGEERFAAAGPAGVSAPATATPVATAAGVPSVPASSVALAVWLLGALVGLGILLAGLVRLARVPSQAVPLADDRWAAMTQRVSDQLGLSRPVRLLTAPDAAICTWGLRRPAIVVPTHAIDWPDERIHTVLCHELAHVSRGDWSTQLASAVLRAVFWFNPLTWVVHSRLRDEAERACDDAVLRLGTAETAYAEHLLEIARRTRIRPAAFTAAMSMARSSALEGRVAAMLNTKASRTVPSVGARAAILAALVAAACGVAVLGLSAQGGPLSLHGSVYDSTGAVLPAVEMALTNDRGIKWTTVTDGAGKFEFDPVGPGEYEFEAYMAGFTSYKKKVTLEGPKDWNRIITLQVGNLEETITATAQRPKQVAAPAAASGARVRVGGNIQPPTKTGDARPVYPESMRAAGLEGMVPLEVVIGKDGKVIFARVVSAQVHPEFAKAAIQAVEQWTFTPTLLNGAPVEVTMTASISFRLVD